MVSKIPEQNSDNVTFQVVETTKTHHTSMLLLNPKGDKMQQSVYKTFQKLDWSKKELQFLHFQMR